MSENAQQGKLDIIDYSNKLLIVLTARVAVTCSGFRGLEEVGVTAEALAICRIRLDYTMR
jgi:hypothetical protein